MLSACNHPCIATLNLRSNAISEEGAQELLVVLRTHPRLEPLRLNVSGNLISVDTQREVIRALSANEGHRVAPLLDLVLNYIAKNEAAIQQKVCQQSEKLDLKALLPRDLWQKLRGVQALHKQTQIERRKVGVGSCVWAGSETQSP